MNELTTELVKQAPALVVMACVVWMFVKHVPLLIKTLEKNAEVMGEVKELLRKFNGKGKGRR